MRLLPQVIALLILLFVAMCALTPLAIAQTPGLTIVKQPVNVARRTFDLAKPPANMPPFTPGEDAECDSEFLSDATAAAQGRQTDATHGTFTITQVKVTLQLNVTIWDPIKVTQHVSEHEEGHRQISEYFYQNADKLAQRLAAPYVGKQLVLNGSDLHSELSKALQIIDSDITNEYHKKLNPEPTQLRYDAITNHSRNEVPAKDAVAQALKEVAPVLGLANSDGRWVSIKVLENVADGR